MNMIVYLWYVAFFALIIVGMKFAGKGKWNEDVMSFDQTKAFLGFCSVAIVLHHCSHKTCVDYIPVQYQRPGLEMFVYVGYLCVAAFFFCSGFGLYKSLKTKPDFMKRFPVRFIPILLPYVITLCCFIALRINRDLPVELRNPVTMPDAEPLHPFSWYIFALVILYLSFYIGFGFVKKDWFGILMVAIGSAGYIVFCIIFEYGSWWYNSVPLFLLGILAGKNEERLMASLKKAYAGKLILFLIITAAGFVIGNYIYPNEIITVLAQVISAITFCICMVMLGLKIKVGNPVLKFLGKMTLELYLVHGLFIYIFNFYVIDYSGKAIMYIESVPLYVLAVFACSVPVAFLISLLDRKISKLLKGSTSTVRFKNKQ